MKRRELIETLAQRIAQVERDHPIRVAIDGVGKTSLAGELAKAVYRRGRPVIRASVDGFHNPPSVCYRRGRDSAEATSWIRSTMRRL